MKPNEKVAMHRFLEELLDEIMKGERSIFLENSMNNKGNGYYPRELTTGSWRLNINVPQDAFAVFIDGYHTEVKDNLKIRKACVYTVSGIDLEGHKEWILQILW